MLPTLTRDPTATLSTLRSEFSAVAVKGVAAERRMERKAMRINTIKAWLQEAQRRGKPLTVRTARMRLRKLERRPLSERTVKALMRSAEAQLVN